MMAFWPQCLLVKDGLLIKEGHQLYSSKNFHTNWLSHPTEFMEYQIWWNPKENVCPLKKLGQGLEFRKSTFSYICNYVASFNHDKAKVWLSLLFLLWKILHLTVWKAEVRYLCHINSLWSNIKNRLMPDFKHGGLTCRLI